MDGITIKIKNTVKELGKIFNTKNTWIPRIKKPKNHFFIKHTLQTKYKCLIK